MGMAGRGDAFARRSELTLCGNDSFSFEAVGSAGYYEGHRVVSTEPQSLEVPVEELLRCARPLPPTSRW